MASRGAAPLLIYVPFSVPRDRAGVERPEKIFKIATRCAKVCLQKGRNFCSTTLGCSRSRSVSMTNRRSARTSRSWRCSQQTSDKRRAIKLDSVTVQLPKNLVNRNRPPRVYIQPRFASDRTFVTKSARKYFASASSSFLHIRSAAVGSQWKRSAQLAQLHQHSRTDFQIRTRVVTA